MAEIVAPGDLLGERYRLERPLGAGGMATVWRAVDLVLDRAVAVKVPRKGWPEESTRRLRQEAKAAAGLTHPSITGVHDYGEHLPGGAGGSSFQERYGHVPYVVMELLDGESLSARLSRGPLPWREAAGSRSGHWERSQFIGAGQDGRGRIDAVRPIVPRLVEGLASGQSKRFDKRVDPTPEEIMIKAGRSAAVLAALAAAALSLTACGDDDGGSGGKELKVWHYEAPDSAMGKAWSEAIKEFEAAHPGVTVKFEEKGFEQIQKTAPMVLNSKNAPDVMEYNKGNATAGLLSKQGLLSNLTAEVKERGWDKLISPNVQVTAKYDDKGTMGGDKWFGVPNYAEYLQIYYNKDLFEKHDVEIPTTFDELIAAMDEFVAADVTPFTNAGAEYMAHQFVYQLALDRADQNWVNAFQRYTGKTNFNDAAWTYGATTFADWVKKGYIAKKSVSLKAEDAGVAFMKGEFPMMFSGSWWFGRVATEAKFDWETSVWPGAEMTLGSSGNLWVVPQGSENKELAYDFIDITMKKKIQNTLGNAGGVPVAADPSAITEPKAKKLIDDFDALAQSGGLAFYPDWPVAGFYDVWVSQTQKLMNGAAPGEMLDDVQKAYDSGLPK